MNRSSQILIVTELLNTFFQSLMPFDLLMSKFFRNNKWIGAHERREIAELSYGVFRKYEKLRFFTAKITADIGLFLTLVFLKTEEGLLSDDEIIAIFKEKRKLSAFEQRFLESINIAASLPLYAQLNYPQWLEPYLRRAFADGDLSKEMLALNEKASIDLRVNQLKSSKDEVKKMLEAQGIHVKETPFVKNGLRVISGKISKSNEVISKGFAEIQDEGSQLVAEICDAHPGNTVVDFCAGAGGKTLAIAAAMQNKGRIFALDKYEYRLENAKLRFRRAGVSNVFCQEINSKWIKRHLECADIVLVDAPCSGTGTWRRNPDMRAKFSQKDLDELLTVQAEILDSAQRLVKKNGKLVYATCSILKEENDDQIEKFLMRHGATIWKQDKLLRLSPAQSDTDGFFAAVLLRS
jgi:16S rRNA (cytosine967-C5)-methyltransferase